jgi:outer membrane cobalamin receptor
MTVLYLHSSGDRPSSTSTTHPPFRIRRSFHPELAPIDRSSRPLKLHEPVYASTIDRTPDTGPRLPDKHLPDDGRPANATATDSSPSSNGATNTGWMLSLFLLAVGLWAFTSTAYANETDTDDEDPPATASVHGTVTDGSTNEPLARANVALLETQTGTSTDPTGQFQLERLRTGTYTVVVTYVGYESQKHVIELERGQDHRVDVTLDPSSLNVGEVSVRASQKTRGVSHGIGVSRMSAEDLTTIASALQADVFRSLQKLPGVKAASDFSSGLHIRGGSPDQTLIRLDGATLYNPTHFLGLFSTINPYAVDDVTLRKGAFSAEYGGRLGSVIDIAQQSGSTDRVRGQMNVGLLASRAAVSGPLTQGSWMVSLRRSTMEPVLNRLNARSVKGLPEAFRFYDINGSASTRLSPASRLNLSFYTGHDAMDFPFHRNLVFDVAYGNHAASARWSHFPNERLLATVEATASRYTTDSRAEMSRTPFSRYNQITDAAVSADLDYRLTGDLSVKSGATSRLLTFDLQDMQGDASILDRADESFKQSAYLQAAWDTGSRWTIEGGLRGTHFSAGNYMRLAPRVSIDYRPTGGLHLQVAGGKHHQFVTRTPSQLLSSFDAWLTAGSGVTPASSYQLTGGVEWISNSWRFDVEGYYRTMDDLFKLDTRGMDASGQPYPELFNTGRGYAYGVEALLKRRAERLNGFLAYTYGKTREQFSAVNGGHYYAPKYDRTHDLSLVVNFEFTDSWRLSSTFAYATGQPYTRPTSQFVLTDSPTRQWRNLFVTSYNNARLPAYRRTDIGVTRKGQLARTVSYEAKLQVVNVLSRSNSWLRVYDFGADYGVQATDMPQIPVPLPNLSFGIEF